KAVYQGELQIHTTLDAGMQAGAEAALAAALPNSADPYGALVSIDPTTGYVKAVVGGRDYADEKFNIVTMGRRQPGSAFKPFVLAAALEHGISPDATYAGPARLCPRGWTPGCVSNFGGESFGNISVTDATVHSVNTVYAQLIMQVGSEAGVPGHRRVGEGPRRRTLAPGPGHPVGDRGSGHQDPAAGDHEGDRDGGRHRAARSREDGDGPGLPQRLVRWLHADPHNGD